MAVIENVLPRVLGLLLLNLPQLLHELALLLDARHGRHTARPRRRPTPGHAPTSPSHRLGRHLPLLPIQHRAAHLAHRGALLVLKGAGRTHHLISDPGTLAGHALLLALLVLQRAPLAGPKRLHDPTPLLSQTAGLGAAAGQAGAALQRVLQGTPLADPAVVVVPVDILKVPGQTLFVSVHDLFIFIGLYLFLAGGGIPFPGKTAVITDVGLIVVIRVGTAAAGPHLIDGDDPVAVHRQDGLQGVGLGPGQRGVDQGFGTGLRGRIFGRQRGGRGLLSAGHELGQELGGVGTRQLRLAPSGGGQGRGLGRSQGDGGGRRGVDVLLLLEVVRRQRGGKGQRPGQLGLDLVQHGRALSLGGSAVVVGVIRGRGGLGGFDGGQPGGGGGGGRGAVGGGAGGGGEDEDLGRGACLVFDHVG